MKIELQEITVAQLAEAYEDNEELGVQAYGGKLDVRPPKAVVETIKKSKK